MKKFKLLVLTDHSNHSGENSLYALVQSMRNHPRCAQIDVASRGNDINHFFFNRLIPKWIFVNKVMADFSFHSKGKYFQENTRRENLAFYDAIWLRMPPPLSGEFLAFLTQAFPNQLIINNPDGIYQTGSKEFLINFPQLCPPMQICRTIEDIIQFKNQFPIVLKPFRDYGGKGIIRIDGNTIWDGKTQKIFKEFASQYKEKQIPYLGVKFLKNVGQGDKRIVVVNGQIIGASLRLPAKDSWICNVAQGGSSNKTKVSDEEVKIIQEIDPILAKMGIAMYGVDTLVGDDGKRVLSEINTTSIGGLPQIARMEGKPLVKQATDLIWDYIIKKTKVLDAITD
ncbi:MAG: RimK family alpha-L-glutamate ligase [Saprospiraceae bacterium]